MTISGSKAASTGEETQKRGQEDRRMNDVKSQREEPTAFKPFSSVQIMSIDDLQVKWTFFRRN